MNIRVLVAEGQEILRAGMRAVLENAHGCEVVAEAADGLQAVELALQHVPDVALISLDLPLLKGSEVTRQIRKSAPRTRVIAVSALLDRRSVGEAMEAGASGYLMQNMASAELPAALSAAMRGEVYLCPAAAAALVERLHDHSKGTLDRMRSLTAREMEVLKLLAEGEANKSIAALLNLSPRTVEIHRSQIMRKVGVKSVAALTKYALKVGLTTLDG